MRRLLPTGSALLALSLAACVPSPDEVCRQMVDQQCERNFACRTDQDTAVFQSIYGANPEECRTKYYAKNGCAERQEAAQNCTGYNAGESGFDAFKFAECQEALEKLSCQAYVNQQNDPKLAPSVCKEFCE
jgi:hypothetical protein